MRLNIQRADLARVLAGVGRVVETRTTIPILTQVLLTAEGDRLTVTGTDLDIQATASAPADISADGSVAVSSKLFSDIAKKAGADNIELSLEGDKLVVKSGRSKFNLQTLPASDFPELRIKEFAAEFEVDLAAMFAPVQFAMSTEETRYYLNGIFLKGESGELTAVATDGHRLGKHVVAHEAEFAGIIVSRKSAGILPKGKVTVSVNDQMIRVAAGDFVLVSKLIDGTFPDYERVIPKGNDKIIATDRDALMKASDRVTTVASERGRAVKLSIAPGGIKLAVHSGSGDAAEDEVEADYSGEPIEIGFNSAYLRDLLTVLPSGPATLALAESGSPGIMTSAGFEGLTLIIMP